MSHHAYQLAQASSAPSTMRKTRCWVSLASRRSWLICSCVPVIWFLPQLLLSWPRAGTSGIGSAGARAAFRFGLDALERGTDCGLPRGCDPVGPPLPGGSEIGPELAGILQPGRAIVLGEREFLGYVRHRAADKPEGDPVRPVEGHGLQRGGNEPAPMHRRVVFGQEHVRPALQDPELAGHRP